MAVRVTAAHTAEARAEARREAGEGGVAAAAATALAPSGFLRLPAPFSEEGNRARPGGARLRSERLSLGWRRLRWLELRAPVTPRPGFLANLPSPHETPQGPPQVPGLLRLVGLICEAPVNPVGPSAHSPLIFTGAQVSGAVLVDLREHFHCQPCLPSPVARPLSASLSRHGPGLLRTPSHYT